MTDRKRSTHSARGSARKAHPVDSRDALIEAAISVFAEKGFAGSTVKDIADGAGVNISLVSYHFGGKEGLYKTCLEGFGQERLAAAQRILQAPASVEEFKLRLQLFAEDFIDIHLTQPDICKLVHRGMETRDPISESVFKSVFMKIFDSLCSFVESAQKKRLIRRALDPRITSGLLFGSLMHAIKSNEMCRLAGEPTLDDSSHRSKLIQHWLDIFSRGTEGT